jgi:hypothetical protein
LTKVIGACRDKVFAWYDNEWAMHDQLHREQALIRLRIAPNDDKAASARGFGSYFSREPISVRHLLSAPAKIGHNLFGDFACPGAANVE